MQVAVLGILIVVGRWLPVDHVGDVSAESRNKVFDTNAPDAT
jgi:hypothetical protein